jgi:hypothetical protein
MCNKCNLTIHPSLVLTRKYWILYPLIEDININVAEEISFTGDSAVYVLSI